MSTRDLLKSTLLIGGAQGVSVFLSILRVKVIALLLGPAGVGMIGIYNNLRDTASIAVGLGLPTSGVREIAKAKHDLRVLSVVRRVLFWALLAQGVIGMAIIWIARDELAIFLTGSNTLATEIGLVGCAVLFSLLNGSQLALLQGMRRIQDLARVTVFGALAGTTTGIAMIWLLGEQGLIWFAIAPPVVSTILATYFTRQLKFVDRAWFDLRLFWQTWQPMVKLGISFMLSGLMTTATLLFVRGYIVREAGIDAAGQFAAAWSITITYVGFILQAMGADYFPRLTEVVNNHEDVNQIVNSQTQLALAVGGPLMIIFIGTAPWLVHLLYSREFEVAGTLLQWQSLGNVFKLAAWPLGYVVIAAGKSGLFLFIEAVFNIVFVGVLWFGFPYFGIEIAGISFLVSYILYLAIVAISVSKVQNIRWQKLTILLFVVHIMLSGGVFLLVHESSLMALVASSVAAATSGAFGVFMIIKKLRAEEAGTHWIGAKINKSNPGSGK